MADQSRLISSRLLYDDPIRCTPFEGRLDPLFEVVGVPYVGLVKKGDEVAPGISWRRRETRMTVYSCAKGDTGG